ncbi:Uma2 family endonuclease [Argonema antarcticum]|uniref:Uma2 family endonuclease n=1 Tax=Argonema antarcticum TaxID=2942763 RepID=UPI002010EDA2|nr:Uma2 family endonuclease [Argonema antarcticum]MCL1474896.1 Uma2 family endonuclease [Argonema antarcticum A004/B2]
MSLTVADLEQLQTKLSEEHLDYQLELVDGKIIVMGPSDIVSSEIGVEFSSRLREWVKPRRLGRVFDSSGGFIMPNSNLTAPDVSFVSADRLKRSKRGFGELVPDLIVEIKSQSDRIKPLREKIESFLQMGAKVGILIDPDKQTVTIYRPNGDPAVLNNGDLLTVPELFPGWEVPVSELWPVEFE